MPFGQSLEAKFKHCPTVTPSQRCCVNVAWAHCPTQFNVAHWALAQTVVLAAAVQAAAPSHVPVLQLDADGAHELWGSCPAGTKEQVPAVPARLHDLQPEHCEDGVSQHTPSTQLPETQRLLEVQAAPRTPLGTQVPPVQ